MDCKSFQSQIRSKQLQNLHKDGKEFCKTLRDYYNQIDRMEVCIFIGLLSGEGSRSIIGSPQHSS